MEDLRALFEKEFQAQYESMAKMLQDEGCSEEEVSQILAGVDCEKAEQELEAEYTGLRKMLKADGYTEREISQILMDIENGDTLDAAMQRGM